jgi:hypothetical protein
MDKRCFAPDRLTLPVQDINGLHTDDPKGLLRRTDWTDNHRSV